MARGGRDTKAAAFPVRYRQARQEKGPLGSLAWARTGHCRRCSDTGRSRLGYCLCPAGAKLREREDQRLAEIEQGELDFHLLLDAGLVAYVQEEMKQRLTAAGERSLDLHRLEIDYDLRRLLTHADEERILARLSEFNSRGTVESDEDGKPQPPHTWPY